MAKLKFMYLLAVIFVLFALLFFLDLIIIPQGKNSLLGAIGIVISAFIASFSVQDSITQSKCIKEQESIKNRYKEFYYMFHILKKIEIQYQLLLENIDKGNYNYKKKSLEHMLRDTNLFIDIINSKDFFFYLPTNEAGILMNIIRGLSNIANYMEIYTDDNNLLMQKIKTELVNHHTTFSLLPFLNKLNHYLENEIKISKNYKHLLLETRERCI